MNPQAEKRPLNEPSSNGKLRFTRKPHLEMGVEDLGEKVCGRPKREAACEAVQLQILKKVNSKWD